MDLVGPLQVFTTASDLFRGQPPSAAAIYRVEVVALSRQTSFVTNSGLRMRAHGTFQRMRGEIDTLLVAGGSAVEQDSIGPRATQWIREIAGRTRRVGSVCTGALLLARAGLLDGRRATTHWNWCELLARRYPMTSMRTVFQKLIGVSPGQYRQHFQGARLKPHDAAAGRS